MTPPTQRIIVVTGASRGFGRAVARALAGPAHHLVLIARTSGALEELDDEITADGGAATLVPLDLTDVDGIDRLGSALFDRFGRIDGLVGAAAQLGVLSPIGHIKPRVWDRTFAVNVTANWRLIRSLAPLLRQSEAGRAVFVTDRSAALSDAYWSLYAASKAALEKLVESYAAETAKTPVRVTLYDPGPMATALRHQAYPGEDKSALNDPIEPAKALLPLLAPDWIGTGGLVRHGDGA